MLISPRYIFLSRFTDYESKTMGSNGENKSDKSNLNLCFAIFEHMTSTYQLLIVPATIVYAGLYKGFFFGEFIAGWVACPAYFGIGHISLILMTYGCCNALSFILVGFLERYTGHQTFEGIGCVTTVLFLCLPYTPLGWSHFGLFTMAGLYGVSDAVLRSILFGNINNVSYIYTYINPK